jgi:uncharacterized integral membrane protein
MKRFIKLVIWIPIALVLLLFAFANRHIVTVSFDPFASGDIPAFEIAGPLFIVLILTLIVGIVVGGVATWFSQGKHRRAARLARNEAERLRGEAQALRAQIEAQHPPGLAPIMRPGIASSRAA